MIGQRDRRFLRLPDFIDPPQGAFGLRGDDSSSVDLNQHLSESLLSLAEIFYVINFIAFVFFVGARAQFVEHRFGLHHYRGVPQVALAGDGLAKVDLARGVYNFDFASLSRISIFEVLDRW